MALESGEQNKVEIGHVLIMDVVGYSKLLIEEQTKLMATLNTVVRSGTRFQVADVAGKLIRLPTGDGIALVFFGDAETALESAVEIATALKQHPEIKVRMGIHSGPVNRVADLNEQLNVAGAGIDTAQRVMDCGDAGHILLSKRLAYDLAPIARWNAGLHELGDCEVKHGRKISLVNFYRTDIGNPELPAKVKRTQEEERARARKAAHARRKTIAAVVFVTVLVAAALGFFVHQRFASIGRPVAALPAPEKSIAVLPFVDLSQKKDQEYFCDGISEELLNALAKTEGMRVVARTSAFAFKGKNTDVAEIGHKLNVATVLEGTLRREGNRVRITAQLVNTRDGYEMWSDQYDRELNDVFALQDDITRAIVDALKVKLAVAGAPRPSPNTEAYDLYLQGLFFSNRSDEANLRKSLELFHKALEKDPKLARAWTGVAKAWTWLADAYVAPREADPQVETAARKALSINELDAEAHCYLGEIQRSFMWDVGADERELKRALEIDPNSAVAHLFLALIVSSQGETERGLKEIQAAVKLDPLSPIIGNFEVLLDVQAHRLDDALAAAKRTMEIDPNYVYFEPDLALVYREQGKLTEALEIYERVAQNSGQPSAGLGITYARLGRTNEAKRVLDRLIQIANTKYFPGEQIASVYAALGDKDEAFRWLDRAMDDRSGPIHSIAQGPEYRSLRDDPRFAQALQRIGLDPARILSGKK